ARGHGLGVVPRARVDRAEPAAAGRRMGRARALLGGRRNLPDAGAARRGSRIVAARARAHRAAGRLPALHAGVERAAARLRRPALAGRGLRRLLGTRPAAARAARGRGDGRDAAGAAPGDRGLASLRSPRVYSVISNTFHSATQRSPWRLRIALCEWKSSRTCSTGATATESPGSCPPLPSNS